DDIQSIPPDRWAGARLIPAPSLHLLLFRYPVNSYYTIARNAKAAEAIEVPAPAEEFVALTRRNYIVRRITLDRGQYGLLHAIIAGHTLADAIAAAGFATDLNDEQLAAQLQVWFSAWTATGFFLAV